MLGWPWLLLSLALFWLVCIQLPARIGFPEMYKAYFKLSHNPFDLTPDPVCFVPTERHNEALAALYHGFAA